MCVPIPKASKENAKDSAQGRSGDIGGILAAAEKSHQRGDFERTDEDLLLPE